MELFEFQNVYFHTSLDAEALVVVVEVVAVEPPGADGKQKHVGCGWGLFHAFQKDKKLFDTSGAAPPAVKYVNYFSIFYSTLFLVVVIYVNHQNVMLY